MKQYNKEWIKTLKSDTPELSEKQVWLQEQIKQHIQSYGSIENVEGIFGELFPNRGYVEKYELTDKGLCTKFYGCSYLYKGQLRSDAIDSGTSVKRILVSTAELVLKYKYFIILLAPFYKKVLKDFIYWFAQIYEVDYKKRVYQNLIEFSPVTKELVRAGFVLAEEIPSKSPTHFTYMSESKALKGKIKEGVWNEGEPDPNEFRVRVRRVIWCIASFFQFDSAYYWRLQDFLANLNKNNVQISVRKEILRLFDIMISRENQIKEKITLMKNAISMLLLFPPLKKIIFRYIMLLNTDEFIPDEADDYWAGRREGYNWKGRPVDVRRKETDKIDEEKGHIIL